MADECLDAELVQRLAALSGLTLTPEGAAALVPSLRPLLEADASIRTLGLERVRPLGRVWPGDAPGG